MRYPGGKNGSGVSQWLISLMSEHSNYGEPFAGSAATFRLKPAISGRSVLVDLDPSAPSMAMAAANVETVVGCGIRWIEENAHLLTADWLLYIDPPYPLETRVKKTIYQNELSRSQHARLLQLICQLDCRVMISSYFSRSYSRSLSGWKVSTKTVTTRGGLRTEHVWSNFDLEIPKPATGNIAQATPLLTLNGVQGFRERERVSRKVRRWHNRFSSLPEIEQRLIWDAIRSVRDFSSAIRDQAGTSDRGITEKSDSPAPFRESAGVDPVSPELVISLFPGIGLLDRSFQEAGFCVVQVADKITGGDVRGFAGRTGFDGLIAGPPCQGFSCGNEFRGNDRHPSVINSRDMLCETIRIISECSPEWFLVENVPAVPDVRVKGYHVQRLPLTDIECGGRQRRLRHFQFGSRSGQVLHPQTCAAGGEFKGCDTVTTKAAGNVSYPQYCRLQGFDPIELRGWTRTAKIRAVGNGVPKHMGSVIANAVKNRGPSQPDDCYCGCGRSVAGRRAKAAGEACRKRKQMTREGNRPFVDELGYHGK